MTEPNPYPLPSGSGSDNHGSAVATATPDEWGDDVVLLGDRIARLTREQARELHEYLTQVHGVHDGR